MIKVELTYEQTDKIIIDILVDQINDRTAEIECLAEQDPLEDFRRQDLKDAKKIRKACVRVLKYFTIAEDFKKLGFDQYV